MTTFDKAASAWDDEPSRVALARGVSSAIIKNIPLTKGMKALEYGCGTGLVTLNIAPYVNKIMAIDASEGMLSVLREKIKKFGVKNVIATPLDMTMTGPLDDRFDLIYTSMTLHHIKDITGILKTFCQMLNPGGFMAIADLDLEDGSFHGKGAPAPAHNGFDRNEIIGILKSLGLKNLKAGTAHEMQRVSADGKPRLYPIFLVTGVS
jgi:ubiquinone/menaquinone biosynthesis C-methylase UbiE